MLLHLIEKRNLDDLAVVVRIEGEAQCCGMYACLIVA